MTAGVSVVLPTYNGAAFLEEALASVFRQTVLPNEIIIVDDCSTDGTRDIAARLARTAPVPLRLLALRRNSGGPARPLNCGIAAASGEFIAVLDQDDVFTPAKLEDQVGHLAQHPDLAFVFSLAGRHERPDEFLQTPAVLAALRAAGPEANDCRHIPGPRALRLFLEHGNFVHGYPGMVFRRTDWRRKGGVDERLTIGSDYDLLCWLSLRGGAGFIDRVGYWRRFHGANLSSRHDAMRLDWYRVLARYVGHRPEVVADNMLSAHLRQCVFDLAYWLRQRGHYREAVRAYRLSLRVWGWEARTLLSVAKLLPSWARRCLTGRPEVRETGPRAPNGQPLAA